LHDSANLISLQKSAPAGGFALVERARQDVQRFLMALHSYGYYEAKVHVTIAGRPMDDPRLPDLIAGLPASPPAKVKATFDLGPQFKFGSVQVTGSVPKGAADGLGLDPGSPAMAAEVVTAQGRLLDNVRARGYPYAKVELPPAVLHLDSNTLDVSFDVQSGPEASIGAISITGLKDMNESFVRQRLLLHEGQRYSPALLDRARQDLASLGVFSVVRMEPADHLGPDGRLPITVAVTERPLHAVDLGISYATDVGLSPSVGWHHRNLFGNAEQLNLTGAMQLGGTPVQLYDQAKDGVVDVVWTLPGNTAGRFPRIEVMGPPERGYSNLLRTINALPVRIPT
ncbi:MAG: hypothetical protein J0H99_13915, partial [Rhodospirillales bacterium]|nr:hypothetical protein [Rhodospirillales bacterium]